MPEDQGTLSGATLGDYQVGTLLGVDGALAMYRTVDPTTGADLALAVLGDAAIWQSDLLNVIRSVVALKHMHIIPIYDVGFERGLHFVVMPMLRDALRERLARDGALSPIRAGQLVAQVAWAVVAMRESGLPEPPITTANILLDDEGLAILADTALARGGSAAIRAFQMGGATGLPVHSAPFLLPEARRAVTTDQREQIYSLGTVLYELLTATEKPPSPTAEQTETLMVTAPLTIPSGRAPELWLELESVMLKALSTESERFKDIREFAIEIRRVVTQYDDGAPSGRSLAVLKRGRRTSPPAFRLEEWALTRAPRTLVEGQPEEVVAPAEMSMPIEAAWEEIGVEEAVAGSETVESETEAVEDGVAEDGAAEDGVAEPPSVAARADQLPPTPESGASTRVDSQGRRGRVASVPLRKNQPLSAAELRARLSGGPAPIPLKRLATGALLGQAAPRATPAPPSRPTDAKAAPPRPHIPAAPLLPPTLGATTKPVLPPTLGAATKPVLPPTPGAAAEPTPAREGDAPPSIRDLDATTQLPFRQAPTAELLATVAARTLPPPVKDVRVRATEPPEVSAVAVRPVFSGATPSMYLGGAQMRLPRRRGERRVYPLVVLAVVALVVALGGAGAIALGAIAPKGSNHDNNTIVVSATQTAQARNAAQPTTTPTTGTTSPARPNVTATSTPAPVGALVVETPTPTPPPPTATPIGLAISIAPIASAATNIAGSCSASFTVSARQAGLSWAWQNDASSPAPLPLTMQYTVNGTPGVGLPVDASTTQATDSVVVTVPCNATPVTYVIDLMSGGASTLYAQFTLTA